MANLSTLLNNRNRTGLRGIDNLKGGALWYHTHLDTSAGRCQFCWRSPGTGCAIVEIWGGSGSGARQCCCTSAGVPGNGAAYSKKLVRVCASSYICGWVGCTQQATGLCYAGRPNCSVACIFNSGDNGCVRAEAGFGGFVRCQTAGTPYCCMRCCAFCGTQLGSAGCGRICNIGGPNGSVQAVASSGDENLPGGISCVRYYCCCRVQVCGTQYTLAISPGIHSSKGPTCVEYSLNQAPTNNGAGGTTGRAEMQIALAGLKGTMPQMDHCWTATRECGCYENLGCYFGGVGIPGSTGIGCADVRSMGVRGGQGAVKITFYN
jgi:hypothetical protein